MFRRLLFLIIGLGLLTAACTSAGLPAGYSDDYCQCAFYTIASELSFEEFLELDEQLKDNPESLSKEQRDLFDSVSSPCAFTADDVVG